jgi:hypothetical protein
MGNSQPDSIAKAADLLAIGTVVVSAMAFGLKHFGPWDPNSDAADLVLAGIAVTAVGYRLLRRVVAPVADNGVHFETQTHRGRLLFAAISSGVLVLAGVATVVWALIFGKLA